MAGKVDDSEKFAATLPDPLVEEPPNDRWCDIVMKGGVASGVVYPWAILEIARKYRLRNIGGTSVGAMAAVIAAACEYGRRRGHPHAYEVLRRLPAKLAEPVELVKGQSKRTVMLSLFQPNEQGHRLFELFVRTLIKYYEKKRQNHDNDSKKGKKRKLLRVLMPIEVAKCYVFTSVVFDRIIFVTLGAFLLTAFSGSLLSFFTDISLNLSICIFLFVYVVSVFFVICIGLIKDLNSDIRNGIIDNDLGLCRGQSQGHIKGGEISALVEWLHDAIQRGAGLPVDGKPLTFEDLWNAPLWPGGRRPGMGNDGLPLERSINLEMVTTNVSHGRPYRLPLVDEDTRLFFDPVEWDKFFPEQVMKFLRKECVSYIPMSPEDPSSPEGAENVLEVPSGILPVVVAARLSLSFPILFSAVPLYAIDYDEQVVEERCLRKCRFSDGGLSSNFPVHFFDSALPRWPTFGLFLEERGSPNNKPADASGGDGKYPQREVDQNVKNKSPTWLPMADDEGRTDGWFSVEPKYTVNDHSMTATDASREKQKPIEFNTLSRFLYGTYLASKDWRDNTAIKMPHVRRRVVRLGLRSKMGEGQLNIAMPADTILEMAKIYGTDAGKKLCDSYAPESGSDQTTDAWNEHLWVRLQVLLEGLNDLLDKFGASSISEGHKQDANQILRAATLQPPIKNQRDKRVLEESQRDELRALVAQVAKLEKALSLRSDIPHKPQPLPKLRLRPPL